MTLLAVAFCACAPLTYLAHQIFMKCGTEFGPVVVPVPNGCFLSSCILRYQSDRRLNSRNRKIVTPSSIILCAYVMTSSLIMLSAIMNIICGDVRLDGFYGICSGNCAFGIWSKSGLLIFYIWWYQYVGCATLWGGTILTPLPRVMWTCVMTSFTLKTTSALMREFLS